MTANTSQEVVQFHNENISIVVFIFCPTSVLEIASIVLHVLNILINCFKSLSYLIDTEQNLIC